MRNLAWSFVGVNGKKCKLISKRNLPFSLVLSPTIPITHAIPLCPQSGAHAGGGGGIVLSKQQQKCSLISRSQYSFAFLFFFGSICLFVCFDDKSSLSDCISISPFSPPSCLLSLLPLSLCGNKPFCRSFQFSYQQQTRFPSTYSSMQWCSYLGVGG